jgi:nucleoid DNA-binding protein
MLDEYIKELIAANNRVILPNFGAFLLRATSKNKSKKELASKINDIYFSPFLKFNDELLMNHIIKKEGLSQKESMDRMAEYIKAIENSVKEKGTYPIEGFGTFYMDNQGKIQFKIQPSATQEEPPAAQPKPQVGGSEKKDAPKTAPTINDKAAQRSQAPEQQKSEKPAASNTSKKTEPVTQRTQKAESTGSTTNSAQSKGKAASKSKTPPPPPPKKSKTSSGKPKSNGNRGLIMSVVIGVPVAVLFIWAMLNFDTIQGLFTKDKTPVSITDSLEEKEHKEQSKTARESKDKAASNESSSEKATQPPKEKPNVAAGDPNQTQAKEVSGSKKYYIVAGSFKKRQNALNFQQNLLDKGYNAEMIGERDGMHAVSYASFKSKSQAEQEIKRMRSEKGVQAWLLHY